MEKTGEGCVSNRGPRFRRTGRALLSLGTVGGALRKNPAAQHGRSPHRMGRSTRVGGYLRTASPCGVDALRCPFLESVRCLPGAFARVATVHPGRSVL